MPDSPHGNQPAYARLMALYRNSIEQECIAYQSLKGPDLSHSDLVQEVAVRVWEKITQFKGLDSASEEEFRNLRFEAWLRKTARSVLNNLYRDRRAQKRNADMRIQTLDGNQDAAAVDPTPSAIVGQREEYSRVRQLLNERLDKASRDVVLLHINEALTFQAIADQLGLTYDQVRHKYRAALKQLEIELS